MTDQPSDALPPAADGPLGEDDRHKAKMQARKAHHEAKVAAATATKGLLIVHTGKGKGKSTAAFGLVLRACGHGMPVVVVQFTKGAWDTGEARLLKARFADLVSFRAMGEGFTWETQDRARDVAAAEAAWAEARLALASPALGLVVLDELNIVLRMGYLDVDRVVEGLAARRDGLHVCVTGRNAPQALIDAADLVTEMTLVKHPFAAGIKAQPGIEF